MWSSNKSLPPQLFRDSYIRKFSVLIRKSFQRWNFHRNIFFDEAKITIFILAHYFCRKYGGWWITGAQHKPTKIKRRWWRRLEKGSRWKRFNLAEILEIMWITYIHTGFPPVLRTFVTAIFELSTFKAAQREISSMGFILSPRAALAHYCARTFYPPWKRRNSQVHAI